MVIHDDGFADGGEAYTDEEMDLMMAQKARERLIEIEDEIAGKRMELEALDSEKRFLEIQLLGEEVS